VSTELPITFTVGEATPPNVTDAPAWKLLPMIVTVVPPATGPVVGESCDAVGAVAAGACTCGALPVESLGGGVESAGGGVVSFEPVDVELTGAVELVAGAVESCVGVPSFEAVVAGSLEPVAGGVESDGGGSFCVADGSGGVAEYSSNCSERSPAAVVEAPAVAGGAGSGVAARVSGVAGGAGDAPTAIVGVPPIVSLMTGDHFAGGRGCPWSGGDVMCVTLVTTGTRTWATCATRVRAAGALATANRVGVAARAGGSAGSRTSFGTRKTGICMTGSDSAGSGAEGCIGGRSARNALTSGTA
jgi:hypothetical protein